VAWDATVEAHYPTKAQPLQPTGHLHRSRVGLVVRWHGNATVEVCYTTKAPPLQPTATSIDPGLDWWQGGMRDATIEACQQEVALVTVEVSYATYQHWLPKGQQLTSESCCSTTRQMRNQILDVNEASPSLSLTAGIQNFPSTIDE